jgi:hypothetical protein
LGEIDCKGAIRRDDKKNSCVPTGGCLSDEIRTRVRRNSQGDVARKDLERRSGVGGHKNEFWWGVGEKSTAQAIQTLISQHGGNIVLFSAIKDQKPRNKGSATDALVWLKYRMLGGDILQDVPKHVLITSAAVTKGGTSRTKHFALVCNSSVPLKMGGRAFRFSNAHYKNLSKDGKVGKSATTGKRTTAALVRWTNSPISGAECDSVIDFSADLSTPYCVELSDPVRISPSAVAKLNQQIGHGLHPTQWLHAVAVIRR